MSILLDRSRLTIKRSNTVLGLEKAGGGQWPVWDRYLTIEGRRAYHIGNICDTCEFFFERLAEGISASEVEPQTVSPSEVSGELKAGLTEIKSTLLDKVGKLLPIGKYQIMLLKTLPKLVRPGSDSDYFAAEQVELWGSDPYWDMPHYPRIEYYRGHSIAMGEGDQLFEFIVPLFPKKWLHQPAVEDYTRRLGEKKVPTALALSILDVKQPAVWQGNPSITRHYCLAHYLVDGHHKTYAAAQMGSPISLLSFLAIGESIASKDDFKRVMKVLEKWSGQS